MSWALRQNFLNSRGESHGSSKKKKVLGKASNMILAVITTGKSQVFSQEAMRSVCQLLKCYLSSPDPPSSIPLCDSGAGTLKARFRFDCRLPVHSDNRGRQRETTGLNGGREEGCLFLSTGRP